MLENFQKDLGKKIKYLREKKGLSQSRLAQLLKISRVSLVQIEKGSRRVSAEEVAKISRIFEVPTDILLDLEKDIEVVIEKKHDMPQKKAPQMRISVPQKNLQKFKEVLLYILNKVGSRPNIGQTVIYKLLYFIDFDFYEKFEEQLTGARYIKNRYGPTPVEFKKITEEMEQKGEIEKVKSRYFQYDQKKYLPRREPDLSKLSAQEIKHIDEVLARFSDKNAQELTEYSHSDVPWRVHKSGEIITYESVFYRDQEHSVRNYEDEI